MDLPYEIKTSKRAKRLRMTVRPDGSIFVTRPARVSDKVMDAFVKKYAPWAERASEKIKLRPKTEPLAPRSRAHYLAHKEAARKIANERLRHFNAFYGFRIGMVRIGNQKSRWGSCSRNGNINFNYRILFLSPEERDYVIVHELCHLAELNHGSRFWLLVSGTLPNHKEVRASLRKKVL